MGVVLFNCESACSLRKATRVMAESWRNGWGWSQRSTSGEARGGWALRELRKLLPPCQLTCKAGCSRCASRAGQVEKEGVLALQGAAGETLKLRPCSACC